MKYVCLLGIVLLLQSCGTITYAPNEYEIDEERIADFPVVGNVELVNNQPDKTKTLFYDSWSLDFEGNYNRVTEEMVIILREEVADNGKPRKDGPDKVMKIKVTRLNAEMGAMTFKGSMDVEVLLGNGQKREISVSQKSPGNMWRTLNGTIAIGVIEVLKDPVILAYLAEE